MKAQEVLAVSIAAAKAAKEEKKRKAQAEEVRKRLAVDAQFPGRVKRIDAEILKAASMGQTQLDIAHGGYSYDNKYLYRKLMDHYQSQGYKVYWIDHVMMSDDCWEDILYVDWGKAE